MTRPEMPCCRALVRFALVVAASAAAASLWAQARPEPGLLLDAQTWCAEVAPASTGARADDGWFRLVPQDRGVDVRVVKPGDPLAGVADALYFRQRGLALQQGRHIGYGYPEVLQRPRMGVPHELSLAGTRFSVMADYVDEGIEYAIGYGGETHSYLLGAPGADRTVVRAIADLDGDRRPDFVIDVDGAVYLLLSTQARPGRNAPTAQYAERAS